MGVTCVIHPGGSIRDQEVIDAADEHNMVMVLTGMRHSDTNSEEQMKVLIIGTAVANTH